MLGKPYLFPRNRTVRHRKPDRKEIEEDHGRLNSVINELRMDSNRLVLTMMEDDIYNNFEIFATNASSKRTPQKPVSTKNASKRPSGSLEAVHGFYHVMVGGYPHQNKRIGGGHMSRVSLAAFDPVFVSPSSSFKPGILADNSSGYIIGELETTSSWSKSSAVTKFCPVK